MAEFSFSHFTICSNGIDPVKIEMKKEYRLASSGNNFITFQTKRQFH